MRKHVNGEEQQDHELLTKRVMKFSLDKCLLWMCVYELVCASVGARQQLASSSLLLLLKADVIKIANDWMFQ